MCKAESRENSAAEIFCATMKCISSLQFGLRNMLCQENVSLICLCMPDIASRAFGDIRSTQSSPVGSRMSFQELRAAPLAPRAADGPDGVKRLVRLACFQESLLAGDVAGSCPRISGPLGQSVAAREWG